MLRINLSAVISTLCLFYHVYATPVLDQQASQKKVGHCPDFLSNPEAIGQCSNQCIYDSDCEDVKKCCLNACGGTSCVAPQTDPCHGYRCPKQGQVCVPLLTHAVCMCTTECPDIYQPVCDSKGNTYSNKCYLDAHACELDLTVEIVPCQQPEETLSTDTPVQPEVPQPEVELDMNDYSDDDDDDDFNEPYIVPPVAPVVPVNDIDDAEVFSTDLPVVSAEENGDVDDDDDDDDDVEAPVAPSLASPSGETIVQEGEEAKIKCDVKGSPLPIIFWKKGDLTMYPGQKYGSAEVTDQGILQFAQSRKEHTGNYLCIAANTAGSLAALYALSVVDDTEDMPTSTDWEGLKGDDATTVADSELPISATMNPACRMAFEVGPCYHYEAVWYYNSETNICEVRSYGGCAGNANRFPSYEQCRAACPDMPTNRCEHPIETGPCRGYFPRFGWSRERQDCVQFTYGGCLGNDNNFNSMEDCHAVCASNEVEVNDEVTVVATEPPTKAEERVAAVTKPDSVLSECEDCEPEKDLHDSYCKNDFVLSGSVALMSRIDDYTLAVTVVIDGLYKHGGLQMTQSESVGMTKLTVKFNGNCLCPDISTDGTRYIIMGNVVNGVGMLNSASYVRTYTTHRFTKLLHIKQNSVYICNPMLNPYQ